VLADDLRKEARTIRRDLLVPLTRVRFGEAAAAPYFRRTLRRPADVNALADLMDAAVNRLGLNVPADWAHEALGLPAAEDDSVSVRGTTVSGQ
jgi:phage gp29-like protein